MKKYNFLIVTTLIFLMMGFLGFSQNSIPSFEWTKPVGGNSNASGWGIAVDDSGHSYVGAILRNPTTIKQTQRLTNKTT